MAVKKKRSEEAKKIMFRRDPSDGLYYYADEKAKKQIISSLSKEGQTIANTLGDHLKLTEEGDVIYPENSIIGSPLVILIEWYLTQKTAQERPLDHKLFEKLMSQITIPKNWIK